MACGGLIKCAYVCVISIVNLKRVYIVATFSFARLDMPISDGNSRDITVHGLPN